MFFEVKMQQYKLQISAEITRNKKRTNKKQGTA